MFSFDKTEVLLSSSYDSLLIRLLLLRIFPLINNVEFELNTFLLIFNIPVAYCLKEYCVNAEYRITFLLRENSSHQNCSGPCHNSVTGLESLKHFLTFQYLLFSLLEMNFLALLLAASQKSVGVISLMQSHHLVLQMWASDIVEWKWNWLIRLDLMSFPAGWKHQCGMCKD